MSKATPSSPTARRAKPKSAAIVVLSDRALFRDCIVGFLQRHGFPQAVGRTQWAALHRPGLVMGPALLLMDLGDQRDDASHVLDEIRHLIPDATVVAVGTPMQLAAQAADADGWVKTSDEGWRLSAVAAAVARGHAGKVRMSPDRELQRHLRTWRSLTPRQREVLALLGCGVDNHRIGRALGVSERAIKMHVSALLDKFKADSRVELALIACHAGLHRSTPHDGLSAPYLPLGAS